VGWSSPSLGASDQEYLRNSEQRSKLNHDRPSRKLMLEAAAATSNSPPAPVLELHQAPAINNANPTDGQLLLLDAPISALGAPVARAPRSKASPAEALRKSARSKGTSDGPVLERAIRATADKNNLDKSVIDTATPSSSTPAPGNSSAPADFVAFQDSSLEHLLKVAKDSCILFKSTEGSPAQAVALLQARERAQAELLAARRRIEEEEAKAKEEAARNISHQASTGVAQWLAPWGSHPQALVILLRWVLWRSQPWARAKPKSLLSPRGELLAGPLLSVIDLSPAKHGL
jgi:hypothetical protein